MTLLNRTGAFSVEYAAVIVVVAAALIGMAVYLKRGLMGGWRDVGDTYGFGKQFEPGSGGPSGGGPSGGGPGGGSGGGPGGGGRLFE